MRFRTLLILTAVLAVVAAAGVTVMRLNTPRTPDPAMGGYLLRDLPVNDIVFIDLKGPSSRVRLEKTGDGWVVRDRFGYPADFSKIADFVRALRDARTGRRFEASGETLARLNLLNPDEKENPEAQRGIGVRLLAEGEEPLAGLVLGARRDAATGASGGRYVTLEGGSEVYLVDAALSQYRPTAEDWLKKDLLDVPASEVRVVACIEEGTEIYRFERSEKEGGLEPMVFPSGEKIDEQALNRLAGALASFRIEDVMPASEADEAAFGTLVEYLLFDGRKILLRPRTADGENDGPMVRISVDFDPGAAAPEGENVEGGDTHEDRAVEAAGLHDLVSRWVFELSRWRFDALITDPEELTASEETPAS